MEPVRGHFDGPVLLTRDTIFYGTVVGDMTIAPGVHLELMGSVIGNLIVEDGATASVRGIVSEAVINRGGSVEVFGAVGSITGTERSHINPGARVES